MKIVAENPLKYAKKILYSALVPTTNWWNDYVANTTQKTIVFVSF